MPHDDGAASASKPPLPDSSEAKQIQITFAELLYRDPQAVIDKTRDNGGHVVLNADDLFKEWPEYAENPKSRRWLGAILYGVAKEFIDKAFAKLLEAEATSGTNVVFTAGGGASGKSTVLRAQADRPEVDFIVDTTFSRPDRAMGQIEAALSADRQVEINYVYREFRSAVIGMVERALNPKVGRIVPIDDLANTHFGAQETIFTTLQRYTDEPRVAFQLWESLPGNRVKRLPLQTLADRQLPALDELQKQGQNILDEIFEDANRNPDGQWKGLSRDRSFYEAARSKTQKSVASARLFDPDGYEKGEAGSEAPKGSA